MDKGKYLAGRKTKKKIQKQITIWNKWFDDLYNWPVNCCVFSLGLNVSVTKNNEQTLCEVYIAKKFTDLKYLHLTDCGLVVCHGTMIYFTISRKNMPNSRAQHSRERSSLYCELSRCKSTQIWKWLHKQLTLYKNNIDNLSTIFDEIVIKNCISSVS